MALPRLRLGLQGRMAASYVLVTAAAVLVVEAVGIVSVLPGLLSQVDYGQRVQATADQLAVQATEANTATDGLKLAPDFLVGEPSADPSRTVVAGEVLVIPYIEGKATNPTLGLVLDAEDVILASSFPLQYPVGQRAGIAKETGKLAGDAGTSKGPDGPYTWALSPVFSGKGDLKSKGGRVDVIGWAYVAAPGTGPAAGPWWANLALLPKSSVGPLIQTGALLLLLLLPLGTLFGVLTSRRVVARLERLSAAAGDFASGDLGRRVPVRGSDEVGHLEQAFNDMAGRITSMAADQARLVGEQARTEERARIARELHDSISQDLFSVSLIAGGLQRALPGDSPLHAQLAAMRDTVDATMSEMRALLLELRPALLDERGLVPALEDLCTAYQERLGVTVDARLQPLELTPPGDHAVLRVAQEGIANAVRHADARHIRLRLVRRGDRAELVVADDGKGFDALDPERAHGLGLRVMRERMRELGGSLTIRSRPGRGTRLVASLPAS
ncbi:MAG TPA: histidine kinase [Candidatus Dormibacteraeota bacterium]